MSLLSLSSKSLTAGSRDRSAHRFDEAIASLENAVEIDSESALARAFLGYMLMYISRCERAIEEMQGGFSCLRVLRQVLAPWEEVYAAAGKRDEGAEDLREVTSAFKASARVVVPSSTNLHGSRRARGSVSLAGSGLR